MKAEDFLTETELKICGGVGITAEQYLLARKVELEAADRRFEQEKKAKERKVGK